MKQPHTVSMASRVCKVHKCHGTKEGKKKNSLIEHHHHIISDIHSNDKIQRNTGEIVICVALLFEPFICINISMVCRRFDLLYRWINIDQMKGGERETGMKKLKKCADKNRNHFT